VELNDILFVLFYLVAIGVIVAHYTGWLEDHGLEWLVYVIAVLVFPVVLFL
jgi:predicted ABC-type exoprotein transport system permease subunit